MRLHEHISRLLLEGGEPVTLADWDRVPPPDMHPDALFEQLRDSYQLTLDGAGHFSILPSWDLQFEYSMGNQLREALSERLRQVTRRAARLWRRRTGKLVKSSDATVTFFDRCGARRLPDGRVVLWLRDGRGRLTLARHVRLLELERWLYFGADTQIDEVTRSAAWRLIGDYWLLFESHLRRHTALLASACCGRNLRKYARIAIRDIWRLFDPDAIRVAFKCDGSYASLHAYNQIMQDLPGWLRLERETPNLLPLVWLAWRSGRLDDPTAPDAVGRLRRRLLDAGLGAAGWKTLAALPASCMLAMTRELDWSTLIGFVTCLRAAGEIPPLTLFVRWQRAFAQRGQQLPPWFLRAAAREAWRMRRRGGLRRFVQGEYLDALDWLRTLPGPPDANQQKAGWAWIRRQSDTWHQTASDSYGAVDARWDSLIGECRVDGLIVTPLTSSDALRAEGADMHHCVGGYTDECVRNESRIFAVRHPDGDKSCRATFEIVNLAAVWQVRQVRGCCNSNAPETVQRVAETIARRYSAANATRQPAPPVVHVRPGGRTPELDDIPF